MSLCLPHHPAGWLIWFVVGAWLIPGTALRCSAGILAVAWALAEDHACKTGDLLPEKLYWALDLWTVALVLFIVAWRGMACGNIFCPVNRREWLLLTPFPLMWAVYLMNALPRVAEWWILWALALTQFLIAGGWPAQNRIGKRWLPSVRLIAKVRTGLP